MALTQQSHYSATLVDELGIEATTIAYVLTDPTGTAADLATGAAAWALDLDAVTGAQIKALRVVQSVPVPGGAKATPAAHSRVEQTAVINFSATGSGHRYGMAIPALKDTLIVAGKLNWADTGLKALVDLITTATGTQAYANTANQAISGVVDAILSFRKRRKQLSRTSFEIAPPGE